MTEINRLRDDETCRDCGKVGTPWHAPNELWNRVMGTLGGTVCPLCFVDRARSPGIPEADQWWQWAPFPHDMVPVSEYTAVKAERDRYRATLELVLGWFTERGHPGRECLRTGWVNVERIAELRKSLTLREDS